ncbi:MAG: hypothetical protein JKY15_01400 [Deltaproteobacteria bacterium]|nr:hypothetical protein [Deltaproteobacteria bacterium]
MKTKPNTCHPGLDPGSSEVADAKRRLLDFTGSRLKAGMTTEKGETHDSNFV